MSLLEGSGISQNRSMGMAEVPGDGGQLLNITWTPVISSMFVISWTLISSHFCFFLHVGFILFDTNDGVSASEGVSASAHSKKLATNIFQVLHLI